MPTTTPGERIRARRQQLGMTRPQLAATASVGERQLGNIERETGQSIPSTRTLQGLDRALQWEPGSAARMYATGQDPTPQPGTAPLSVADQPLTDPAQVLAALTRTRSALNANAEHLSQEDLDRITSNIRARALARFARFMEQEDEFLSAAVVEQVEELGVRQP
ncbi:helix-turn-helix transcriptional regulator [Longispora sp. NPDC051575]|uniref:helix-turn-helix domain-containing protein n=1 Tax=Longispora sp. NPDC051575 TaxID=3154943 RepID=UPI00341CD444